MKMQKKIWGLVFVVLAVMIILSGCESGNSGDSADVVYNFAGSVGKGDFINVEVDMVDKLIDYEIKDLSDAEAITQKGSYNFSDDVKDFYITNNDQDYFLILNNEVLIATDSEGNEGEQIITAFSEPASPYGQEIEKKYNIITSLEGARGTVELKQNKDAVIWIDLDGDGTTANDSEVEEFTSTFEYDDLYKAVKIIENDKFQHYGVFLDGKIGVFDSYMYDADSWTGDGMSILVEQNSEINYSDFDGVYNFIDVDSDIGTIDLSNTGTENMEFIINVTGEVDPFVDNNISSGTFENNEGLIIFESDISGVTNKWYMMLVPDNNKKILILGTQDSEVFGGEEPGGIFIGIEQ